MKRWGWLWLLPLVIGLAVLLLAQQETAADLAASYSGNARIDGPLQLEINISPPVAQPGDQLSVAVSLLNTAKVTHSPELSFRIPAGLRLDTRRLPSGLTINLQDNSITWLPILPANGGSAQFALPIVVETADISQPERRIMAVLKVGETVQETAAMIWVGLPPQVNSIISPAQVAVGQPVRLQTDVSGSGPYRVIWYPGDGRRIDVAEPVVAYPAAGVYDLAVEVINPLTAVSGRKSITVVPHPAAQFTVDDGEPGVGQTVTFQNQSGGQPPLTYRWDFGDGQTASDQSPQHQYTTPGVYQVHLVVENGFGQSDAYFTVAVGNPPAADMAINESAPLGQPILGQAVGDAEVTRFRWDMGDGHVYEGPTVSHVYRSTGDFYVSMTAYSEFGGTEIGRWIHIDPGALALYMPIVLQNETTNAGETAGLSDLFDPDLTAPAIELTEPFMMEPLNLPNRMPPAEQLLVYINAAREQFALPPLAYVYELSIAAQQHTDDMAAFHYTAHQGSDGSYPVERFIWSGYTRGYAGEATAWGFEEPRQAVEFWVNSPPHRRIILNPFATDVGVGYTVDFTAPNVWYWTAEFGNGLAAGRRPFIRLQATIVPTVPLNSPVVLNWNWPTTLQPNQQFVVSLLANGQTRVLGTVSRPQLGTRYSLQTTPLNFVAEPGVYQWQVMLQTDDQFTVAASERQAITLVADPNALPVVTVTATPTLTPTITATPTPTLTPTAMAPPSPTPAPALPTVPPLVTATPRP